MLLHTREDSSIGDDECFFTTDKFITEKKEEKKGLDSVLKIINDFSRLLSLALCFIIIMWSY